ncbi:MAG: hypothetical protein QOG48_1745 [Verrucomicrobiota bacterium]
MRKRLTRISPLQLGIVHAVFYGLISLVIFTPIFLLVSILAPHAAANQQQPVPQLFFGMGIAMAFIMPFLYAIFGFIMGVIMAAIYNLVARMTGGIEFTVEDAPALA